MHAVIGGKRVHVDLSKPQRLAIASAPYQTGLLLPSCSDATAAALINKGLAFRKRHGVILSPAGCELRQRLRAELGWNS